MTLRKFSFLFLALSLSATLFIAVSKDVEAHGIQHLPGEGARSPNDIGKKIAIRDRNGDFRYGEIFAYERKGEDYVDTHIFLEHEGRLEGKGEEIWRFRYNLMHEYCTFHWTYLNGINRMGGITPTDGGDRGCRYHHRVNIEEIQCVRNCAPEPSPGSGVTTTTTPSTTTTTVRPTRYCSEGYFRSSDGRCVQRCDGANEMRDRNGSCRCNVGYQYNRDLECEERQCPYGEYLKVTTYRTPHGDFRTSSRCARICEGGGSFVGPDGFEGEGDRNVCACPNNGEYVVRDSGRPNTIGTGRNPPPPYEIYGCRVCEAGTEWRQTGTRHTEIYSFSSFSFSFYVSARYSHDFYGCSPVCENGFEWKQVSETHRFSGISRLRRTNWRTETYGCGEICVSSVDGYKSIKVEEIVDGDLTDITTFSCVRKCPESQTPVFVFSIGEYGESECIARCEDPQNHQVRRSFRSIFDRNRFIRYHTCEPRCADPEIWEWVGDDIDRGECVPPCLANSIASSTPAEVYPFGLGRDSSAGFL